MNKFEKQRINDKYEQERTPFDFQLKCCVKEISFLESELNIWNKIKDYKDFGIYDVNDVEKNIRTISDRLEEQKNCKLEIENKIYHYKKENDTRK